MPRYYTRACNFYYGNLSKKLVKEKTTVPLSGSNLISFDSIELITRKSKKKILIKKVNRLPRLIKKKSII
jgi:dihydropteroate synthase